MSSPLPSPSPLALIDHPLALAAALAMGGVCGYFLARKAIPLQILAYVVLLLTYSFVLVVADLAMQSSRGSGPGNYDSEAYVLRTVIVAFTNWLPIAASWLIVALSRSPKPRTPEG